MPRTCAKEIETLDDLKKEVGQLDFEGQGIDVNDLLAQFEGNTANVEDIKRALEEKLGSKVPLVRALDAILQGELLRMVSWDQKGKGYRIGEPFDNLPVIFQAPSARTAIVPAAEADTFSELNSPEWQRVSLTDYLSKNY